MEVEISPLLSLTQEQPVSAEILNTEVMEVDIPLTEKVLLDKKILGHIFANLPKDELSKIRIVNSIWRSAASALIRLKQQGFYVLTTSDNLQKFVDFWQGRNDNILYKNFAISPNPDYPHTLFQLFWETISQVVTNLRISYADSEKSFRSLDLHSNLNYPSLKNLTLIMYNVCENEPLATCKNVLFGLLQVSPNLEQITVSMFGDYRSNILSDFLVDSLKTRDNQNLKGLHLIGGDIVDRHFISLAEITNLRLTQLSLDIPKFEDSQLSGEGLIKFLESQSDSLETFRIFDLIGVFDTCEFPRLESLCCLEVQKWTRAGTNNPQAVDIGIDYHKSLPNLRKIHFGSLGRHTYGLHKFLPLEPKVANPVTFVTSLQIKMDVFLMEEDVLRAVKRFRNLKCLDIPAWYRPLMEVYKTQESLENLIIHEDENIVQVIDKILTGLEPREQLILNSTVGLLDKLTLNCENVDDADNVVSIGCLKRLKKLQIRYWQSPVGLTKIVVPSLLTYKLVLTRMKSLEKIDFGNGRKLLMRDLPQDRPLINSDILTNAGGKNKTTDSNPTDISLDRIRFPSLITSRPLPRFTLLDNPLGSGSLVPDELLLNQQGHIEIQRRCIRELERATTKIALLTKRPAPE